MTTVVSNPFPAAIDSIPRVLKEHPFLKGLDPNLCALLYSCASLRRFASQQLIFHEGGQADHFYLIINGRVALETLVRGSGIITVQELGAGDALGWSWLFPPYQWHFTAATRQPTEVISFAAEELREKAEQNRDLHNELLSRVVESLYHRLLATRAQMIQLCRTQARSAA